MDHDPDLQYISVGTEHGDSIIEASLILQRILDELPDRFLTSNTPLPLAYAWTLCVVGSLLARCVLQQPEVSEVNLQMIHHYATTIINGATEKPPKYPH